MTLNDLYLYFTAAFGFVWLTSMIARLPVTCRDTRMFYRCFRDCNYRGNSAWLSFSRVLMPSLIGAPLVAYMDPENFFRRMAAPDVYDMAQHWMNVYGPDDEPEEENTNVVPFANTENKDGKLP